MKYTITITSRPAERFAGIFASSLAKEHGIPIQLAVARIDETPFVYLTNIVRQEMLRKTKILETMGVEFTVEESDSDGSQQRDEREASVPQNRPVWTENSGSQAVRRQKRKKSRGPLLRMLAKIAIVVGAVAVLAELLSVINLRLGLGIQIPHLFNIGPNRKLPDVSGSGDAKIASQVEVQKSQDLADSAAAGSAERALPLYLEALALDPHNFGAWYAVLKNYQALDSRSVDRIRQKMVKLFGSEALQLAAMIDSFGSVSTVTLSEEVCRLEYHARSREKQQLIEHSFQITRRCQQICGCRAVSIYARTRKGSGLLTYYPGNISPVSRTAFLRESSISFTE